MFTAPSIARTNPRRTSLDVMTRSSAGCRNCVRRRVLCDETYPSCRRCQKKSLQCDGPRGRFQFVNTSIPGSDSKVGNSLPSPPLHKPQLSTFGLAYPPGAALCYLMVTAGHDHGWLHYCLSNPDHHPLTISAIDALAAAKFAKKTQNTLSEATRLYVDTLINLRDALNSDGHRFDILATVTALNRYEIIMCSAELSWLEHAGGLSKAIQSIGPAAFTNYPYDMILNCNRYRLILDSYHRRRPCFLSLPEWSIPRTGTDIELHLYELEALYCKLAQVAHQVTTILTTGDEALDECTSHLIESLLQDCDEWVVRWKKLKVFTVASKQIDDKDMAFYNDSYGLLFTTCLEYSDIEAATGVNTCMAFKITSLEWKQKFQHRDWWAGPENENMIDIPQMQEIALDICRSLHIHNSDKDVPYLFRFIHAAFIAQKAFPKYFRESQWLRSVLRNVSDQTGTDVALDLVRRCRNKWRP